MKRNELAELARWRVGQGYDFCPFFLIELEPMKGDYRKVDLTDVQAFFDKRLDLESHLPPSDKEHQRRLSLIGL